MSYLSVLPHAKVQYWFGRCWNTGNTNKYLQYYNNMLRTKIKPWTCVWLVDYGPDLSCGSTCYKVMDSYKHWGHLSCSVGHCMVLTRKAVTRMLGKSANQNLHLLIILLDHTESEIGSQIHRIPGFYSLFSVRDNLYSCLCLFSSFIVIKSPNAYLNKITINQMHPGMPPPAGWVNVPDSHLCKYCTEQDTNM